MEEAIKILNILKDSPLNGSQLLILCTMWSQERALKVSDMVDRFGWEQRWTEDNILKLRRKGFVAQTPKGNRYKLSKNGVNYATEIFHKINAIGTPYG